MFIIAIFYVSEMRRLLYTCTLGWLKLENLFSFIIQIRAYSKFSAFLTARVYWDEIKNANIQKHFFYE